MKTKFKYMHTLDGQPAYFCPEERQIFFAGRGSFSATRLVDSVAEIHRNERVSVKTRKERDKEMGPTTAGMLEMGWVKVRASERLFE